MKDRLTAVNILLERGYGRAPVLVRVAGDNDDTKKPAIASQSNEARQAFAREVLDCLVSSGAVQLPAGATLKRDDEETIDAEAVRHVEFPEVVSPARPLTRDALLASANTPVERALKP